MKVNKQTYLLLFHSLGLGSILGTLAFILYIFLSIQFEGRVVLIEPNLGILFFEILLAVFSLLYYFFYIYIKTLKRLRKEVSV